MPRPTYRKIIRRLLAALLLLALAIGLPVAYRRATGNLGSVEPGRVFRSAQLSPEQLTRVVRERGVRTVLNLRGPNPDQPWYRGEVGATLAAGAVQVDVALASDQWLSRDQARTLLEVLEHAERPILVHCEFGAERTGLVSAIVRLLEPGGSLRAARDEFSVLYLFLPTQDGRVMLAHLDAYEAWLDAEGLAHDPARFRRWLTTAYVPGSPSREYWPCNPYPRKVVTRPGPDGIALSDPELPPDACPKTVATSLDGGEGRR